MGKNSNFFEQPIFSQMINLIDTSVVSKASAYHNTYHYCKRFTTFQHPITMLHGVVSGCNPRELTAGIVSYGSKISHCKFDYMPRRNTISEANKRMSYNVFKDIYNALVKKYLPELLESQKQILIDKKVYAIDSATMKLFQPIFD